MSSQSKASAPRSRAKNVWIIPIAVVALAAIMIAFILLMNRESATLESQDTAGEQVAGEDAGALAENEAAAQEGAPTEVQNPQQPDLDLVERRDGNDPLAVGNVDAPVTLVVFSDYQCPFCAKWSVDTMPVLMEDVEAGNLRIEWRDINIFGPASDRGSRAAYAAALQGAFLEYHDALFAGGNIRSESELSDDALLALAAELGLDTQRFVADYSSPETEASILENQALGLELGVMSTPSFIMAGEPIVGAQPTEVFVSSFDNALAEVGGTRN